MVGEVGADPTTPEETDLQSAAVADLLLSQIKNACLFQAARRFNYCYLIPTNWLDAGGGFEPQVNSRV